MQSSQQPRPSKQQKKGRTPTSPSKQQKTGRKPTSKAEFMAMVLFLEIPDNFKLITGSASNGKPVIAGQKLTKSAGYSALASFVNQHLNDKNRVWIPERGKSRFESFKRLYKKTKAISEKTGFGITDQDRESGIAKVEDKLDTLCPFYSRMDQLFGHRQNVTPSATAELGVPPDFFPTPRQEESESGSDSDHGNDVSDSLPDSQFSPRVSQGSVHQNDDAVEAITVPTVFDSSATNSAGDGIYSSVPQEWLGDDDLNQAHEDPWTFPVGRSVSSYTPPLNASVLENEKELSDQTRPTPIHSIRSTINCKRSSGGISIKKLDFSQHEPKPKQSRKDLATVFADVQNAHIDLENKRFERELFLQEQQASIQQGKLEIEKARLILEKNNGTYNQELQTKIAKANFVAGLMASGVAMSEIQKALNLIF